MIKNRLIATLNMRGVLQVEVLPGITIHYQKTLHFKEEKQAIPFIRGVIGVGDCKIKLSKRNFSTWVYEVVGSRKIIQAIFKNSVDRIWRKSTDHLRNVITFFDDCGVKVVEFDLAIIRYREIPTPSRPKQLLHLTTNNIVLEYFRSETKNGYVYS